MTKSIRACTLSKLLAFTELTTFSVIAISGDKLPTIDFGWIVILRMDGFMACTTADLLLALQLVTVRATSEERQISSRDVLLIESIVAIFGSTNANVSD